MTIGMKKKRGCGSPYGVNNHLLGLYAGGRGGDGGWWG